MKQVSTVLRRRRVGLFRKVLDPGRADRVLDVGTLPYQRSEGQLGAINPLLQHYPWPDRVFTVGIERNWQLPLEVPYVVGDGRKLPFVTDSVDFVFSNAVIEHVGGPAEAAAFVAECWRVARKGIWVSTPNRSFPIEIHTLLPIVHWLPLGVYWWTAGRLYHPEFGSPQGHYPLGEQDLREFLPPGCEVLRTGGPWPIQLVIAGRKSRK